MKYSVIHVGMNELHTQQMIVAPWEVPVLQAIHGSADVTVVGAQEVEREPPEPSDEFRRLENRYRAPPGENSVSYVAQVYGTHGAGVQQLAEAIEQVSRPAVKPKQKEVA